ncbi:hypothetical protein DC496_02960 [Bifidobacterium breve]|uniref:Uncharacterized protein n=1 Tax=Bifidobacterium breve TaxID=1685 RepID=A0AAW7LCI0_BIFBR|nr:hypothetical protein [Bifidobacterium breve]MDN4187346.1 hypothetical protein [Bifidobacterium breve]
MSLITNLYGDPKALQPLNTWLCSSTQNHDGKYTYTSDRNYWSVLLPEIKPGYVIAVDFDTTRRDAFKMENCSAIYSGHTTLAGIYNSGNCSLFCSNGKGVSVTINRIGIYSQDDWNRLQQYGLDWFDGDTMPLG